MNTVKIIYLNLEITIVTKDLGTQKNQKKHQKNIVSITQINLGKKKEDVVLVSTKMGTVLTQSHKFWNFTELIATFVMTQ